MKKRRKKGKRIKPTSKHLVFMSAVAIILAINGISVLISLVSHSSPLSAKLPSDRNKSRIDEISPSEVIDPPDLPQFYWNPESLTIQMGDGYQNQLESSLGERSSWSLKADETAITRYTPTAILPDRFNQTELSYEVHSIDVPYINQNEFYLTACESVSMVMVMHYFGIDITVDDFLEFYLNRDDVPYLDETETFYEGNTPWRAFLGSPYNYSGFGCYAPVIVNAANKIIDHDKYIVTAMYDRSLEELCARFIDQDVPVVVWATIDMEPATYETSWIDVLTGEEFDWYIPEHCLVLVGYDEDFYYFNDPFEYQMIGYYKEVVEVAYQAMESQAVVMVPKE